MRPDTPARVALVSALLIGAAACASRPPAQTPKEAPLASAPATAAHDYRLGPEDVVEISVWRNETLSRTVPVRPDGAISLPLINDVQAAGLTPMELRAVLAQKLAVFVTAPEVSVIVREVHSAKVAVLGEVARPGRYELRGPTTVLEMLAFAGGLGPFASRSRIVVLRPNGRGTTRFDIDAEKALNEKSGQNLVLHAGDLVFVP